MNDYMGINHCVTVYIMLFFLHCLNVSQILVCFAIENLFIAHCSLNFPSSMSMNTKFKSYSDIFLTYTKSISLSLYLTHVDYYFLFIFVLVTHRHQKKGDVQ